MVSPEEMNSAINMIGDETAKEIGPAIEIISNNIFEKNMLPMDAMGLDHNTVESMYIQAVHFYNTAQYAESARAFHALLILQPAESKFYIGLGACHQMLGDYQNAITAYGAVGIYDPENPVPHYHASDCYAKQDLIAAAIAELEIAIELCGSQAQYAMMKDRSVLTIQSLKEKGKPMQGEQKPSVGAS